MGFQEPLVVANIGSINRASRHVGSCFSLSGQRKRKRAEIVLGTDSANVAIFEAKARGSRGVANHGIPPGETFLCPPVSVVVKHGKVSGREERYTYWATFDNLTKVNKDNKLRKVKVTCLHQTGNVVTTHSTTIGSANDPVVAVKSLEVLPSEASTRSKTARHHELLVLHEDGSLSCYSPNLKDKLYTTSLPFENPSFNSKIAHVTTMTFSDAGETLLRHRADILAPMSGRTGNLLVCVLETEQLGNRVAYFLLASAPSCLLSLHLPITESLNKSKFMIHDKTSKLYELRQLSSESQLAIYDLGDFTIKIESSMQIPSTQSFARISAYSMAVGDGDALAIYDVRWKTLQGKVQSREAERNSGVQVLNCFSGTAFSIDGDSLCTYNVCDEIEIDGRSQKRRRIGGLADAVGRGLPGQAGTNVQGNRQIMSQSLGKRLMPSSSRSASATIRERFDPLLCEQNSNYDEQMLHVLETVSGKKKGASTGYAAQPDLIAYAVCGLFEATNLASSTRDVCLRVRRMAPETFRFLLTRGLLTLAQIQKSLRAEGSLDQQQELPEASVIKALTEHDATLQALIYYVSSAPLLSAHELSAALLVCLETVQRLAARPVTKTYDDDKHATSDAQLNGETSMKNGIDSHDKAIIAFEGDWPDPDPEEDLTHNARSALGSCLTRLSLCSDKDVQRALRVTMTSEQILVLVDYIRMELSSGGWLARYLDEDLQGEFDLSAQTNQVNVAAKVLNCAIDSLGAATWLLGSGVDSNSTKNADKIRYMQAEINAALEGIENSAFLENILHEVLLYTKSAEDADQSSIKTEIVPVPVGMEGREKQMLPLGMKKERVPRTRIAAGGEEVQRSARDIGRLESKKVPEYSFERIMI